MQLFIGLTLVALHASLVHAQNSTTTDLFVNALKSLGLDAVAAAIDFVASDPLFAPVITELGTGNKTFFVPTNFSLSAAHNLVSDFPETIRTFQYHIARGQLSPTTAPVSPTHVIAPSLLTDNTTVLLKGGDAQWLVATKQDDGKLHVLNQPTDAIVTQSQKIDSLNSFMNIIENFLVPPGNLSATLRTLGLTQFQANLQKAGLLDTLANERGVTIFAPSDSAFAKANSSLSGLDGGTLKIVLQNHILNTTVYSPNLGTSQLSVTGQTLHMSSTSVSAGGNTAQLSRTDVGLMNGVLHVVDTVLMDKSVGPSSGAMSVATNTMWFYVILVTAVALSLAMI